MMFVAWIQKDALLACKTERAPTPTFAQLFVVCHRILVVANYGSEAKWEELMNILICGKQSDVGSHKACP